MGRMTCRMNSKTSNPQRGEIWYVRFDPTIGSEFRKTRPAVVVNGDEMGRTNMRIVVPITNWKSDFEFFPWVIRLRFGVRLPIRNFRQVLVVRNNRFVHMSRFPFSSSSGKGPINSCATARNFSARSICSWASSTLTACRSP